MSVRDVHSYKHYMLSTLNSWQPTVHVHVAMEIHPTKQSSLPHDIHAADTTLHVHACKLSASLKTC